MDIVLLLCLCVLTLSSGVKPYTTENPEPWKVMTPPLIVEEPERQIIYAETDSIEVVCIASGEPQPNYTWTMNGLAFDPSGVDGRIVVKPGEGTMVFVQTLARDEGVYQCNATNQLGSALSVKADLRVAYLQPFPIMGTREHRPQWGDSLSLFCNPPPSFPAPDIFWSLIVEGETSVPVQLDDRVTMNPAGDLHFVNIRPEDYQDGRMYACVVLNQVLQSTQMGAYARVIPQGNSPTYHTPSLLWANPTYQIALLNNTWRMKCIFSGNPTPRVDWRRVNGSLPDGRWYEDSYGQELVIENIQFEDTGIYECDGVNDYISAPITQSFFVSVEAVPYWVSKPQSMYGVEGGQAVFTCECGGSPQPINFWYINGVPTSILPEDPNRIVETTTLTFLNLTTESSKVIQCNCTNKHGYQHTNAFLDVIAETALPSPPENVTVFCGVDGDKDLERKEAQIIWQLDPEYSGPISNFIVQFNTSSSPNTWYDIPSNISRSQRDITVELAPYENYTFRVLASNKIGISDPSMISTSCNLSGIEEIPPKNPDNVTGQGNAPDNLIIYWMPMPRLQHYGPDFRYIVEYHRVDEPQDPCCTYVVHNPDVGYLVVQNQPPNQAYYITVKAANSQGECAEAPEVVIGYSGEAGIHLNVLATVRTRIVAPPLDKEVVKTSTAMHQCGVIHDPNVTVHWFWFHNNVLIEPENSVRHNVYENGSLVILATRNADMGVYKCDVRSSGGNDSASANMTIIEIPYRPYITETVLNDVDMNAVDVSWSPGHDGNTPILYYIMEYRTVPTGLMQNEEWIKVDEEIPPNARMYTVTGLLSSTSYQFRISAVNSVGVGEPSLPSNPPIEIP